MEPEVGFEPTTFRLQVGRSCLVSFSGREPSSLPQEASRRSCTRLRALTEIRTRDLILTMDALFRWSYQGKPGRAERVPSRPTQGQRCCATELRVPLWSHHQDSNLANHSYEERSIPDLMAERWGRGNSDYSDVRTPSVEEGRGVEPRRLLHLHR